MTPLAMHFHDVNEAYCELQKHKERYSEWESTRNGPALVFQAPVLVTHTHPFRRVLFDPIRDANPFFHYMEAIWMLAGEQNLEFLEQFVPSIKNYSDDGYTLSGAYGHRWRNHWQRDQLEEIIEMLKKDPGTRRAVLTMWDPEVDLDVGKDLPCNTHIYFRVVSNFLEMTVCNRSNDLVWGMLGSNIVTFAILQEYVASAIDRPCGSLHQFTNNLHVYEKWEGRYDKFPSQFYARGFMNRIQFGPLTMSIAEAQDFVDGSEGVFNTLLSRNAVPMRAAYRAHKAGDKELALFEADKIFDSDWRTACLEWLQRRNNTPGS